MAEGLRRFAFAMGTFHVAVLALVVALAAYAGGGLRDIEELHPLAGFALFGLVWLASVAGTHWALAGVHDHAIDVAIRRGIGGGALAGVLVFLVLLVMVALSAATSRIIDGEPMTDVLAGVALVLVLYGVIGGIVAAGVGGAIGFLFSLVDWFVLTAAGIGDGWTPRDEVRRP